MDQLKTAGVWLRKNYFWVSCAFVTLFALGVWFMTTRKLSKEADDRTTALEQKRSTGEKISSEPDHPNPITNAKMDELIVGLSGDVYDAWLQQYQKQETVLTWPPLFVRDESFLNAVKDLKPIEAKVKFPVQSEPLTRDQRSRYQNFIYRELPEIAKIMRSTWSTRRSGGGGVGLTNRGDQRQPEVDNSIVLWNPGNQQQIEDTRFSWASTPSTLDILYAQEDIWVLKSLMEIINATNGDVEHRYKAAVKTIEFIDFGRDATGSGGALMGGGMGAGAMMGGNAMGGGMGAMMSGSMPGSLLGGKGPMGSAPGDSGASVGTPGTDTSASATDPGDYRYVDLSYQPLTASAVRAAFTSRNPKDAFLMVAKRIPVRMRLKVDQRKLPKLLAETGNASLPLEVRQLRINRPATRSSGGGGSGMTGAASSMMSGSSGGVSGAPASISGGGGSATAAMAGGGGAAAASGRNSGIPASAGGSGMGVGTSGQLGFGGPTVSDESPFDVDVELFGIVYIYNPVDTDKLGRKLEAAPAAPAAPTGPATETTTPPTTAQQQQPESAQPVTSAG